MTEPSFSVVDRIEGLPDAAQRELASIQRAILQDLRSALRKPSIPELKTGSFRAEVGSYYRLSPGASGQDVLLPASRVENRSEEIRFLVESVANGNPVLSVEGSGTLNQSSSFTARMVGLYTAVSSGAGDWSVSVPDNLPLTALADQADDTWLGNISGSAAPPTAIGLATLAGNFLSYNAGAHRFDVSLASVTYTAGDGLDLSSLEFSVDVSDFAGALLADDGSNNLTLANLAGTSILGRSAGTTGAVAAITASANDTILRRNTGGVLDWGRIRPGMFDASSDVPLFALEGQSDDTFLANISGGSAPPTAVALSTLGGIAISYNTTSHGLDWTGLTAQRDNIAFGIPAGTQIIDLTSSASIDWDDSTTSSNEIRPTPKLSDIAAGRVLGIPVDGSTGEPGAITGTEVTELLRYATTQVISGLSAGGGSGAGGVYVAADFTVNANTTIIVFAFTGAVGNVDIGGFPDIGGRRIFCIKSGGAGYVLRFVHGSAAEGTAERRFFTPGGATYSFSGDGSQFDLIHTSGRNRVLNLS